MISVLCQCGEFGIPTAPEKPATVPIPVQHSEVALHLFILITSLYSNIDELLHDPKLATSSSTDNVTLKPAEASEASSVFSRVTTSFSVIAWSTLAIFYFDFNTVTGLRRVDSWMGRIR